MATTVVRTCDRCEKVSEHLWCIGITCEPLGDRGYRAQFHVIQKQQSAEWCEACVTEMRIRQPLIRAEVDTPPPTIEDLVRAIVKDEQNGGG